MLRRIVLIHTLVLLSFPALVAAGPPNYWKKNESCSGCGIFGAEICDEQPTVADSGFKTTFEEVPRTCRSYGVFETADEDCAFVDPYFVKSSCPPTLSDFCCFVSITANPVITTPDPDDKIFKLTGPCGRTLVPGGPGGSAGGD